MVLRCLLILGWVAFSGCALTATRPVQEMYNAEAAIKAAKDLHADSLVPELFRTASEYHFKAKREYRLKNFEVAKNFALRAMKLAEQAEFEAYRKGGATPEVANSVLAPEGANPDHEAATGKSDEIQEAPTPVDSPVNEPQGKNEAPDKGMDYNEFMAQQEAEKAKDAAAKDTKKEDSSSSSEPTLPPSGRASKPGGSTGPEVFFSPLLAQATNSNVQTGLLPTTGSLPPTGPGAGSLNNPTQTKPTIDTDRWIIQEDSKTKPFAEIPSISDTSVPIMELKEMQELGHDSQTEQEGLETLPETQTNEVNREIPTWGDDNREDKK